MLSYGSVGYLVHGNNKKFLVMTLMIFSFFLCLVECATTPWENGHTVSGWWSNMNEYSVSDGTNSFGRGLCSLGHFGSPQRALSAIPNEHNKKVTFGISFVSTYDITALEIEFLIQQWKFGGVNQSHSEIIVEVGVFDHNWYNTDGWGALMHEGLPWQEIPELIRSNQ